MEDRTGTLTIDDMNESSLTEANPPRTTLLARPGPDPLGEGTRFLLEDCGLSNDERITVTGGMGPLGGGSAFFMTNAVSAGLAEALPAFEIDTVSIDDSKSKRTAGRPQKESTGTAVKELENKLSETKNKKKSSKSKAGRKRGKSAKKSSDKE